MAFHKETVMEWLFLLHIVFLLLVIGVICRIQAEMSSRNALGPLASSLTHFPLHLETEPDDAVRLLENNEYIVREESAAKEGPDCAARTETVITVSEKARKKGAKTREVLRFTFHEDELLAVSVCGKDTTPDGRIVFLAKNIMGEIGRAVAYRRSVALRRQR